MPKTVYVREKKEKAGKQNFSISRSWDQRKYQKQLRYIKRKYWNKTANYG